MLGLTGLPGVGKSTLATVLYDALKDTAGFIRSCFVPDVRATLRARGPERLQHMMLHHLAHQSFEPLGQLEGAPSCLLLLRLLHAMCLPSHNSFSNMLPSPTVQ